MSLKEKNKTSECSEMNQARVWLNRLFGYPNFRSGQHDIIEAVFEKRDVLGVLPTGGGKSITYQIPALTRKGLTLVISPLISLMKDQVDTLRDLLVPATFINSSLSPFERTKRMREISEEEYRLLYITPERLNKQFLSIAAQWDIKMIAVDEAHCVSQWGHDFRPSYLAIADFVKKLPNRPQILALTATATPEVRKDIVKRLEMKDPKIIVRGFDRNNLRLSVKKTKNRHDIILDFIKKRPHQSGIVYAGTRKEVEKIYDLLVKQQISVGRYHAGLPDSERHQAQEDFLYERVQVMVATNAFGMGIDKSNVRFVIHANMPKDPESYYQEAGRAGRDGDHAECLLLYNDSDLRLHYYFIEQAESETSKEIIQSRRKKLKAMIDYVYTRNCLRHYLLNYFGEETKKNCHNCSNCDPREWIDMTIDAQKILSCIHRLKEPVKSSTLVKILKGSKEKKILQKKWDQLSTYALLKHLSSDAIQERISWLISEKFILTTEEVFPLLNLSPKAYEWIKRRGSLSMPITKTREEPEISLNQDLFELLRKERLRLARKEDVPPYRIFSDKTLTEIASLKPNNQEDFRSILGVGQYKLEKYGRYFLKILSDYQQSK